LTEVKGITVIIPCFNEAEGIPHLCDSLRSLLPRLGGSDHVEFLFVNDGSTDLTESVIRREALGLPYRILAHDRNRGIGAAFKTGFSSSLGQVVVTLDADCTYDPASVPELLGAMKNGVHIATGSPYHPRGEVVGVPGWRLILSKALSRIYWMILPGRLYTYTSCFRAYSRDVIPHLEARSDGFLAVTEFLASALMKQAVVAEIPARLTSRRFGQSKLNVNRVMLAHLGYVFRLLRKRMFKI
jgi:dolichol-phosphate mannosyltransferase